MADKVTFVFDPALVEIKKGSTPITPGLSTVVEVGDIVKIMPIVGYTLKNLTGASAVSGGYKCNAKTVTVEVVGPHAVINYPTDKIVVTPASAHVLEFISITAKPGFEIDQVTGATFDSGKNKYKINSSPVNITAKAGTPPPPPPDQMVVKSPQFWHHVKNINNMN